MKNKMEKTIEYLNHWRDSFLSGTDWSFEKNLGVTEIRDDLSGISEGGKNCYASYLFSQLSKEDKELILSKIDFIVNFDELYAVYEL
jgi:hypothetical protein